MVKSLGTTIIHLATPPGIVPIIVSSDVLSVEITALIGLDVIDSEILTADAILNRLVKRTVFIGKKWTWIRFRWLVFPDLPVRQSRPYCHVSSFIYLPLSSETGQNPQEFLSYFIWQTSQANQGAKPDEVMAEISKIKKYITSRCDTCQGNRREQSASDSLLDRKTLFLTNG